jgi:hypothetical protein
MYVWYRQYSQAVWIPVIGYARVNFRGLHDTFIHLFPINLVKKVRDHISMILACG